MEEELAIAPLRLERDECRILVGDREARRGRDLAAQLLDADPERVLGDSAIAAGLRERAQIDQAVERVGEHTAERAALVVVEEHLTLAVPRVELHVIAV